MTKKDPNEPITRQMLDEAVETILHGVEEIIGNTETKLRSELQSTMQELKTEIRFVKDGVKGLEEEFSTTPTRGEFTN